MATATVVPVSSSDNNFETIQNMLYSPEVTVNPGKILESPPIANDKPIKISQKNLSTRAIDFINNTKLQLENEVKRLKIKNSISNSTLFDEVLHDKIKRSEKQKCSEILGFTLRKLSPTELTKFGLDATKTFYIIDSVSCGSVAAIVGFKVGDIIIGMYNTDGNVRELFDYNDEEALYNSNGNDIYDDRTILYINIRVLRHVKTTLDFDLSYLNITPIFERTSSNVLYHGKRFILPYYSNQNNTVIQLGSLFFKKYISGLTDYKQVGGMQPVQPNVPQGLENTNALASAALNSDPAVASAATNASVASASPVASRQLLAATQENVAPTAAVAPLQLSSVIQGSQALPSRAVVSPGLAPTSSVVQSSVARGVQNSNALTSTAVQQNIAQGLRNLSPQGSAALNSAPAVARGATNTNVASAQAVGPLQLRSVIQQNIGLSRAVENNSITFPDGILPTGQYPLKKQHILLINLYLNQIFNTILLNTNTSIPLLYKNSTNNTQASYSLPNYPQIDYKNDKRIISKVNSLLDPNKSISSEPCSYQGGNKIRIKKQKTIKKKIRNIKNKKSLKNNIKIKMNKKIKKCVKKCIKNNIFQKQRQKKQQQENKYRIKKLLESKIHEKINKLKLNKTKNCSKNKSYHHKYTRKNY